MAHRQHRGDVRLPHPWHRNRIRRLPAWNRQHCVLCAIWSDDDPQVPRPDPFASFNDLVTTDLGHTPTRPRSGI